MINDQGGRGPRAEGRRLRAEGREPRAEGRVLDDDGGISLCVHVSWFICSIQELRGFVDGRFRRRLWQYLTSFVKYWIAYWIYEIYVDLLIAE